VLSCSLRLGRDQPRVEVLKALAQSVNRRWGPVVRPPSDRRKSIVSAYDGRRVELRAASASTRSRYDTAP
jgi:hypothetical protein